MKRCVSFGVWRLSPLLVGLAALLIPTVGLMANEDASEEVAQVVGSGAMEIIVDHPADGQLIAEGEEFALGGWAVDSWGEGPGIDTVVVFANGLPGEGGTMLGAASYGMPRPDVASATGVTAWTNSGFDFAMSSAGFETGPHTLFVFARSTEFDQWGYRTVNINIVPVGAALPPPSPDLYRNTVANRTTQRLMLEGCGYGYVSNGVQCVYIGTPGGFCPGGYVDMSGTCAYAGYNSGVCLAGYLFNGTQCVFVGLPATSCPAGYLLQNGVCNPYNTANCGAGYLFDGLQCVYAGNAIQACPAGAVFQNGVCVNFSTSCGAGFFWDGIQCSYAGSTRSTDATCPAGQVFQNGACQTAPIASCGPGFIHNGTSCILVASPAAACPAGSVFQNGSCSNPGCLQGYDASGNCLYSGGTAAVCPTGSVYQNGSCGAAAAVTCVAGYIHNGTQCVFVGGPGTCPAGAYYSGGQCVTLGAASSCPSGYVQQGGVCRPLGTSFGNLNCGLYYNPYARC